MRSTDREVVRLLLFISGRRKRFYARGEKFENFSHKSLRRGFARAHIYIHIHTRGREKERKGERERIRESQRDY